MVTRAKHICAKTGKVSYRYYTDAGTPYAQGLRVAMYTEMDSLIEYDAAQIHQQTKLSNKALPDGTGGSK